MYELEELSNYVKVVLAVTISENVIRSLEKRDGYDCCRNALDLCWEWIERKNFGECAPWALCFYLDHETGIDLLYYAETEEKGKVYDIVLGTVSYIASLQFGEKKEVCPQYLSGIKEDNKYYMSIIEDAIDMEDCSYGEKEINNIINYCNSKVMENSEFVFCKAEITVMFLN